MTAHAPRLPFSLDPLIAEAKQHMRRRRLLVAAALAVVVVGTTAGVVATRSPAGTNARVEGLSLPAGTRFCGWLDVGIGWRVWASSTMSCQSGKAFMQEYMRPGSWPGPRTFRGYACTTRVLPAGVGSFNCVRGEANVIAISNH
jgi:hypothetical protein